VHAEAEESFPKTGNALSTEARAEAEEKVERRSHSTPPTTLQHNRLIELALRSL